MTHDTESDVNTYDKFDDDDVLFLHVRVGEDVCRHFRHVCTARITHARHTFVVRVELELLLNAHVLAQQLLNHQPDVTAKTGAIPTTT